MLNAKLDHGPTKLSGAADKTQGKAAVIETKVVDGPTEIPVAKGKIAASAA